MEKSLVVLILFCLAFFGATAQQVDSCEQIRLRRVDTTDVLQITPGNGLFTTPEIDPGFYHRYDIVFPNPSGGYTEYRTRYFPEAKTTPKINLWANSQPFKIGSYRITNTKLAGWAVLSFAGTIDGIVEGYEFDGRTSFERKYGVTPNGYFGSRSWEKAHTKENLYTKYFGAWDFYHNADDARKIGYIGGGVIIGIGSRVNTKWWHYAVDVAASFAVSGAAKSAGMFWIRN